MRMRRMLSGGEGYYHVISRITGQQFLMNAEEKDVLMRSMFNVAIFSGVEILTFALMDNHYHLLVKVPRPHEVDEAELLKKMSVLYGDAKTDRLLDLAVAVGRHVARALGSLADNEVERDSREVDAVLPIADVYSVHSIQRSLSL